MSEETTYTITIRRPQTAEELGRVAELLVRFYRVNEEFDPLYSIVDNAVEAAKKLLERYSSDEKSILLVAVEADRIIGFIHGEVRENPMLSNSPLGVMMELYVHPSYRRRGVAAKLVEAAENELRDRGAKAIAAEFPYLNEIAVSFYDKLGFRPLTAIYVKELEE